MADSSFFARCAERAIGWNQCPGGCLAQSLLVLVPEPLYPYQSLFELIVSCAVCTTNIPTTRCAKRTAWYYSHLFLEEQFFRKLLVAHTPACNRREGVEC